ncbi:hypothetical protein MP228_012322 [Amoeboaphelidium protococcarum]|nr:hypothetical protein MP228_012322 [Amoeboaphelidium protococcarum]
MIYSYSYDSKQFLVLVQIPKGKVSTYKEIAQAILKERGEQGGVQGRLCQAVGNSLARNPFAKHLVPCHRVIPSNGLITGYHGKRTLEAIKERLNILQCEGVDLFELQSVKSSQLRLRLLERDITRFV